MPNIQDQTNTLVLCVIVAQAVAFITVSLYIVGQQPRTVSDTEYDFRGRDITNAGTYNSTIPAAAADLAAETAARIMADTSLGARINEEATARGTVASNLTTEITDRRNADEGLSARITDEVTARVNVSSHLTNEISDRESNDASLSASITAEATARGTVANNLTTEIYNRESDDDALGARIDTEISHRQAGDTAIADTVPRIIYSARSTTSLSTPTNNNFLIDAFVNSKTIGSLNILSASEDTTWRFDVRGRVMSTGAPGHAILMHAEVTQGDKSQLRDQNTVVAGPNLPTTVEAEREVMFHLLCDMRLNHMGTGWLSAHMFMAVAGGQSGSFLAEYSPGEGDMNQINLTEPFKVNIGLRWGSADVNKVTILDACAVTQCVR